MKSAYDPHSVCGYDPDTGEPRELPDWMRPTAEAETAARAAAVAKRYEVLDGKRQALRS
jgi:hypothetical protein